MARRKEKGAATPQLAELAIMVLMLLFFIILLTSALSAFTGTEQGVVKLNAELLRSKMTDACRLGKADIQRLAFPQSTPYPTAAHRAVDIPGFLSRAYIKIAGDPKYVLYYEAFPIGEAVGWEVYHDFDYRIIAPFAYSKQSNQPIDFVNFEKELHKGDKNTKSHVDKVLESANKAGIKSSSLNEPVKVIVNNIVLTDQLNPIPNEEPKPFAAAKTPRAGDWKLKPADQSGIVRVKEGDNTFEFSSYALLTSLEQTALKYRSCGKNSLCLKTQEGVERLKLPDTCNNEKLEYIQLEYDNTAIAKAYIAVGGAALAVGACVAAPLCITISSTVAGAALTALKFAASKLPYSKTLIVAITAGGATYIATKIFGPLFRAFLSYKASDFYLVSPCALNNVQIEKASCNSLCSKWMKYPLYEVEVNDKGERRYVYAGDHYQCIENIQGTTSVNTEGPKGACLKVKIQSSPEGFCWTADPTRSIFRSGFLEGVQQLHTQALAWLFGFTPVQNSALYMQNPSAIVLMPKSVAEGGLTTIDDFLERRYTWSWPGSGEKLKTE